MCEGVFSRRDKIRTCDLCVPNSKVEVEYRRG